MAKETQHQIPKKKIEAVKELTDLINTKRTVLIADISSIPGSQYQAIVKKLRGKATVKVPKRNLLFRALENAKNKEIVGLKEKINGPVALLFSDLDSYELASELLKNKSAAKAKPGQTSPKDLEIPAGPTDLTPGPAISELGALGIQIMIQGGKIEIKEPKVVTKAGEEVSQGAADMLSKLNILPFTIGFTPVSAYDAQDNIIYVDIKINTEEAISSILEAYSKALPFAVEVGYMSNETLPFMIQKAARHERRLIKVITGEPDEEPVEQTPEAAPAQEETKEEKKEEANADFAASFF